MVESGGRRVQGGGWRAEGGGWRVEGGVGVYGFLLRDVAQDPPLVARNAHAAQRYSSVGNGGLLASQEPKILGVT